MPSAFWESDLSKDYVEYIVGYAREDWLGFSVISPKVARLARDDAPVEDMIPIFRRIISELLAAGAEIGDFADTEGAPFVPWPGTCNDQFARVEQAIRQLGVLPMSGDVGWITFPDPA